MTVGTNSNYALHTSSGLVHFGDAVDLSSNLAVTGASTFSGGISSVASLASGWYTEGTFTATLTGVSGSVTGTAYYVKTGKSVILYLPSLTGTSNASTCTVTGMPSAIFPTRGQRVTVPNIWDNDIEYEGFASIATNGTITPSFRTSATAYTGVFTSSGSKGFGGVTSLAYSMA
jgi:hypothetical protein